VQLPHSLHLSSSVINDQVTKDGVGRACSRHGEQAVCIQNVCGKVRKTEATKKTKTYVEE
jgi:hypothetical protein